MNGKGGYFSVWRGIGHMDSETPLPLKLPRQNLCPPYVARDKDREQLQHPSPGVPLLPASSFPTGTTLPALLSFSNKLIPRPHLQRL